MIAKVTDYFVDGENKLCSDVLELDVNLQKTGKDKDVIEMWIRDECVNKFGVDIMPGFKVINIDKLLNSCKEEKEVNEDLDD